jgi:hypothetical protein
VDIPARRRRVLEIRAQETESFFKDIQFPTGKEIGQQGTVG